MLLAVSSGSVRSFCGFFAVAAPVFWRVWCRRGFDMILVRFECKDVCKVEEL